MGKSTKIGSVYSQSKTKQQAQQTALASKKFVFSPQLKEEVDESIPLKNNEASSPIAYDLTTGIKSNSPEIIVFSNFIPAYKSSGELNELGKLMEIKQDAMLVSAMHSINTIFDSSSFTRLNQTAKENKKFLLKFCEEFGTEINDLLTAVNDIRLITNLRNYYFSLAAYKKYNISETGQDKPLEFFNILSAENEDHIKNWTTTKYWLQSVRKFKELLKHGPIDFFLSDGTNLENIDAIQNYKNPYKLTRTRSQNIKRHEFKTSQPIFTDMATMYRSISNSNAGAINDRLAELKTLFSGDIFTRKIVQKDSINLARTCFALCKEYKYSTKMDALILSIYGYSPPQDQKNTRDVWDYLIGEFPEDITVVPISPKGQGNSLASLAQRRIDNNEVLLFEDRYIDDGETGTNREGAVITPGSYYYIESSLNSGPGGFNVSRITQLNNNIKNTLNMLDMVSKVTSNNEPATFDDPVKLFDAINERIVKPFVIKKLQTNASDLIKATSDVSVLLMSMAANDPELKSLLFMHQLSNILTIQDVATIFDSTQPIAQSTITNIDSFLRPVIAQKVKDRINKILSRDATNKKYNNINLKIKLEAIDFALAKQNTTGQTMLISNNAALEQVGLFLRDIAKKHSENKMWFNTRNVPINAAPNPNPTTNTTTSVNLELTPYSGIQKIVFYAALFELCINAVSLANPYRIIGYLEDKVNQPIYGQGVDANTPISPTGFSAPYYAIGKTKTAEAAVSEYQEIISSTQQVLSEASLSVQRSINSFRFYLSDLFNLLSNFQNNLSTGKYSAIYSTVRSILGNVQLTSNVLNHDQLMLVRSKLQQVAERCKEDYASPVSEVTPYFSNLSSNPNFDNFVPLEDTHLISWKAFLKSFLKEANLREDKAHNSKIMSIGIPLGLYRRLQVRTRNISSNSFRNGIINLSIYRVDTLRPDLVHHPLNFIFDMKRYPIRILKDYVKSSIPKPPKNWDTDVPWAKQTTTNPIKENAASSFLSGKNILDKNLFPMLESFSAYSTKMKKILNYQEAFGGGNTTELYPSLSNQEKIEIYRNHVNSFLLEEYIRFLSDTSVDENRFIRYEKISELSPNTLASQIVNNSNIQNGLTPSQSDSLANDTNNSVQKFFMNETLFGDFEAIRKNLISPRKFDRVFHVLFDPDDFKIDLSLTSSEALAAHSNVLRQEAFGSYFRKDTLPGEITFDKYYVSVTTYDETNL